MRLLSLVSRNAAPGGREAAWLGPDQQRDERIDVENVDDAVAVQVRQVSVAVGVGGRVAGRVQQGQDQGRDVEGVDGPVAVEVAHRRRAELVGPHVDEARAVAVAVPDAQAAVEVGAGGRDKGRIAGVDAK